MDDDRIFKALADTSRRLILDRLFERDGRSLTELQSLFPEMTRFGVMKHLRVLEEAGLVVTRKHGREKLHYLNPVPIRLIHDRWISKYAVRRVAVLTELKTQLEGGNTMMVETAVKPKLVYQIFINAAAERVWKAITSAEFTARYFYGSHIESDLKEGSAIVYYSPDRSTVWVEGEVLESDPPHRLVVSWHNIDSAEERADPPSRVTWEIEPVGDSVSKLTLIHDGFEEETKTYRQVAGGWPWVLSGLKTLLETGQSLPQRK